MTTLIKRVGCMRLLGLGAYGAYATRSASAPEDGMPKAPMYRPQIPQSTKMRVDGHVRGTDDAILTLTVLAPEDIGLTTKEQPSLYWYQSKAINTRFE